jgi:hypothetical protein
MNARYPTTRQGPPKLPYSGADNFNGMDSRSQDGSGRIEYPTTDIYFAAYLKTIGVPFSRVNRMNSNGRMRLEFVFDITEETDFDTLKDDYFIRSAEVPSAQFVDNIKTFKSMCYS